MSASPQRECTSLTEGQRPPFLIACLSMVLNGAIVVVLGALLPVVVQDFSLGTAQAGMLVSSPAIGYVVATLLAGTLADRWGYREVWLAGTGLGAIACLATALVPSYGGLLLVVIGLGLVGGLLDSGIDASISLLFGPRSGSALNQVHLFFGVGATATPFLVSLGLSQGMPWRGFYLLLAALCLAVGLVVRGLHLPRPTTHPLGTSLPLGKLLASPLVAYSALALLVYGGVEGCAFSWSALYFNQVRALAPELASLSVSAFSIMFIIGRLVISQIVGRLGAKRVVLGGSLLGAAGWALLLLLPGKTLPWGGLVLVGLAFAGIFPTIVAEAARRAASHTGAVTGLVLTSNGVGKIILPALVGWMAEGMGLAWAMGLAVIFSLVMALLYRLAWRSKALPQDATCAGILSDRA